LLGLRFLPREKSSGLNKKDRKEAKESESGSYEELVYKVESYKVCKVEERF